MVIDGNGLNIIFTVLKLYTHIELLCFLKLFIVTPQYHISELRMPYIAKCYCINAIAVPYNATCRRIQESCMLAIKCSLTKTGNRQKSAITADLTCAKCVNYKILENYGHETFIRMRMFVCLHICVSPSMLNQRIDLNKM